MYACICVCMCIYMIYVHVFNQPAHSEAHTPDATPRALAVLAFSPRGNGSPATGYHHCPFLVDSTYICMHTYIHTYKLIEKI